MLESFRPSFPMSQESQESDLRDAQTYLSCTTLRVDRCRHESVTESTLWFFDAKGRQIAAARRLSESTVSGYHWHVSRMLRGMPVSSRNEKTLLDVIGNVMRYEPQA